MTDSATAVATIKAYKPDRTAWQVRAGGYVGWNFGELARYLGYPAARQYAESVRLRVDYAKYQDTLLNTTFSAFLEAEKQTI